VAYGDTFVRLDVDIHALYIADIHYDNATLHRHDTLTRHDTQDESLVTDRHRTHSLCRYDNQLNNSLTVPATSEITTLHMIKIVIITILCDVTVKPHVNTTYTAYSAIPKK